MSYVTGSHSLKVGMQMQRGHFTRNDSNHAQGDYYILSVNGDRPLSRSRRSLPRWRGGRTG